MLLLLIMLININTVAGCMVMHIKWVLRADINAAVDTDILAMV
jgi:hypothetical protein